MRQGDSLTLQDPVPSNLNLLEAPSIPSTSSPVPRSPVTGILPLSLDGKDGLEEKKDLMKAVALFEHSDSNLNHAMATSQSVPSLRDDLPYSKKRPKTASPPKTLESRNYFGRPASPSVTDRPSTTGSTKASKESTAHSKKNKSSSHKTLKNKTLVEVEHSSSHEDKEAPSSLSPDHRPKSKSKKRHSSRPASSEVSQAREQNSDGHDLITQKESQSSKSRPGSPLPVSLTTLDGHQDSEKMETQPTNKKDISTILTDSKEDDVRRSKLEHSQKPDIAIEDVERLKEHPETLLKSRPASKASKSLKKQISGEEKVELLAVSDDKPRLQKEPYNRDTPIDGNERKDSIKLKPKSRPSSASSQTKKSTDHNQQENLPRTSGYAAQLAKRSIEKSFSEKNILDSNPKVDFANPAIQRLDSKRSLKEEESATQANKNKISYGPASKPRPKSAPKISLTSSPDSSQEDPRPPWRNLRTSHSSRPVSASSEGESLEKMKKKIRFKEILVEEQQQPLSLNSTPGQSSIKGVLKRKPSDQDIGSVKSTVPSTPMKVLREEDSDFFVKESVTKLEKKVSKIKEIKASDKNEQDEYKERQEAVPPETLIPKKELEKQVSQKSMEVKKKIMVDSSTSMEGAPFAVTDSGPIEEQVQGIPKPKSPDVFQGASFYYSLIFIDKTRA